jgi:hypothetical protein
VRLENTVHFWLPYKLRTPVIKALTLRDDARNHQLNVVFIFNDVSNLRFTPLKLATAFFIFHLQYLCALQRNGSMRFQYYASRPCAILRLLAASFYE